MTQFDREYPVGSWGKGLLLWGLLDKFRYDQDIQVLEFVRKWVNQSIETQTPNGELSGGDPSQGNFALIGVSALHFAELAKKPTNLHDAIRKQADYLLNPSLKRSDKGAIYYLKALPQIYVDLVIMICPFLVRVGNFLNEPKYTDEAIKQLLLHVDYLKDPGTNLFRHIWDDEKKNFYEGSLWGRGNGWMLAGLVEVAEQLSVDHPKKQQLITEIQRLAESLMLCQDESGLWRTLLDDISEESKAETAGTLIITYGLSKAIRNQWIDAEFSEYVLKAFEAVISCVNEDGVVTKASGQTVDPKRTPYNKPYPHAQGFFLITTFEISKLLKFLKEKDIL